MGWDSPDQPEWPSEPLLRDETPSGMDVGVKAPYSTVLPQHLASELALMRRNTTTFAVGRMIACRFCSGGKGERQAFLLVNNAGEDAGTWCSVHGWLWFDSDGNPPTERLSPSEIAERQLARRRSERAIAARKEHQ